MLDILCQLWYTGCKPDSIPGYLSYLRGAVGPIAISGGLGQSPPRQQWEHMEIVTSLVAAHTMSGALTAYGGEFVGQPLFCSTPSNPLSYDSESPKWIALRASQHGITWQCGDLIYIPGVGMFRALDAGPFGNHCVVSGDQCLPIVADVPALYASWELSVEGSVVNLSAVVRGCRERGICD